MTLEHLVRTYGYAAVALGTFLEGETILVLAGFLAHQGYLALPGVVGAAFAGSFAGDQLIFHLGRHGGPRALERWPRWKERAERVYRLLHKYQNPVIVGFRFLYGMRTVTPFVIGASGVGPLRFFALNGVGAALWAAGVASLGFLLGRSLNLLLGEIKRFELAILAVAALLVLGGHALLRRRARHRAASGG